MTKAEIQETLEKQLQLLSERSQNCPDEGDLARLTAEMVSLSSILFDTPVSNQN